MPPHLSSRRAILVPCVVLCARWLSAADCNDNGVDDVEDIARETSPDCNSNDVPDECDVSSRFAFPAHSLIGVPSNQNSLAVADLDGDGNVDVLVPAGRQMSILWNGGGGDLSLRTLHTLAPELGSSSPVVADFNGDSVPDIASAGSGRHVFLGLGNREFRAQIGTRDGLPSVGLAVSDLDGDGDLDLASPNFIFASSVTVSWNDGRGFFTRSSAYTVAGEPLSVAPLDIDRDGDTDLAAGSQGIHLLANRGSGEFDPARPLSGAGPGRLVSLDLDRDGWPDMVAATQPGSSLQVFLGDGLGSLSSPTSYAGSDYFVETGDLEGDGDGDLLTFGERDNARFFFNSGDGTFADSRNYSIGVGSSRCALADMDRDGDVDLVAMNTDSPRDFLSIFSNRGDGDFQAALAFDLAEGALSVLPGDFDRDGRLDLLAVRRDSFTVVRNQAGLDLVPGARVSTFEIAAIEAVDIDGDEDLDVALGQNGIRKISLLRNASGSFEPGPELDLGVEGYAYALASGDLNGDGEVDIAGSAFRRILLFHGDGTGDFAAPEHVSVPGSPGFLIARDLDADGDTDLAGLGHGEAGSLELTVLRRQPGGLDAGSLPLPLRESARGFIAAQVDGRPGDDFLLTVLGTEEVLVLATVGTGSYAVTDRLEGARWPNRLAAADFDTDGLVDLAVSSEYTTTLSLFEGLGDGRFAEPFDIVAGDRLPAPATGDFDGDGRTDIAFPNAQGVSVLLNHGRAEAIAEDCDRNRVPDGCELQLRDCDGDGLLDACQLAPPESSFEVLFDVPVRGLNDVAAGDLDGDGLLDFVTTTWTEGRVISLLQGNGRLVPAHELVTGSPIAAVLSDLDGDGDLETAFTQWDEPEDGQGGVGIAQVDEQGMLVASGFVRTGREPIDLRSIDIDGDGDQDLATANLASNSLSILRNEGGGTFTSSGVGAARRPVAFRDFDLEGDGDPDLAVVSSDDSVLQVVENAGDGSFSVESSHPIEFGPEDVAAGDLNGDGLADLAVTGTDLFILENEGSGALSPPVHHILEGDIGKLYSTAMADVDGDAAPDVLVGSSELVWFPNRLGEILSPRLVRRGSAFYDIEAADFDGDAAVDIAYVDLNLKSLVVLANRTLQGGEDCNHDGVPDACEPDCDASGTPDACDIARGLAPDGDGDGIPDSCSGRPRFHRGDANADGALDISDGLCLLEFLFIGASAPSCREASDANNDGQVDCSDAILVLGYLFLGSQAPDQPGPPPGPCGIDGDAPGSAGDLGCAAYDGCVI